MRMDPPPSLAPPIGIRPSATAAAEPPDEPPLLRVKSKGLWVAPKSGLSAVARNPKIGQLVAPSMIAPAASTCLGYTLRTLARLFFRDGMPPMVFGQPGYVPD